MKDLTQNKVWISYDSELDLGIANIQDCEIDIAEATLFKKYVLAPWNTPNILERNLLE